jgi:membrane dipeptidase
VSLDRAIEIHRSLPVVDGHNDLPWELHIRANGSLTTADPRTRLEGYHSDLPRMLEGGVGVQFWSVFVPAWTPGPLAATHRQIDLVHEISELAPEHTAIADDAAGARKIRDSGRIAGFMGVEGGHSIENDLGVISGLHERGVRYMTLTHGDTIDWADSATDAARHGGLTDFGLQVVAEMNRLGMLIDISHVSSDTMRAAVEASRAPVIASHSSAFALAPHPRNVPDDVIEMVAATGGVIMVTFVPAFLVHATAVAEVDMFEDMRTLRKQFAPDDEAGYSAASAELAREQNIDAGSVGDVVDHIEYITGLVGVAHVGIGSDFDGTEILPVGLEDVTAYPRITAGLLDRGWSEKNVRLVLGENALRVLAEAEAAAG